MNKSAIKGFSVRARRKLIEDITQKAYALGVKDKGKYDEIEEFEGGFRVKSAVNQIIYPMSVKKDREKLIAEINRKGFEQVIEEVSYTWFNRIIAIRFMEINEYLPVKVRMLSSETKGKTEPDVLTNIYDYVNDLELDGEKVFSLKENHKDEELFKYIFVRECNNLGKLMPQVFEAIGDYTELLLPDLLLSSGSVIRDLNESIEEEDFKEEVEIIGWMYQYYISEKKDEVFAALKNNKKITKENIPAATQLFTPKWIVKYMTENSLGRLWQESHPDETLKQKWDYYIEPAKQEPEVQKQLDELKNPNLSPEEIKILDPAMGSGHILVYAFDVLYDIYLSRGYAERDIPLLILEKNLYGLDIDDRAAQLASFALLMKARSKNRRFFKSSVELNICSIQESNGFSKEALKYLVSPEETQIEQISHFNDAKYLIDVFRDANEFGSILKVETIDVTTLEHRIDEIKKGHNLNIFEYGYRNEILELIPHLLSQVKILSQKYHVTISNPPYMGKKGLNSKVSDFLGEHYNNSKGDLFAVFMEKCIDSTIPKGYSAMINQHSWMFLSTYELLRKSIISNCEIISMLHLGSQAFEDIAGEVVQSTTYVMRKLNIENYCGKYFRLINENSPSKKEKKFIELRNNQKSDLVNVISTKEFIRIPGGPIAYWASNELINGYQKGTLLSDVAIPRQGIATANNNRFLRMWHEVDIRKVGFGICSREDSLKTDYKWFPYNKGGGFRKWFGNNEYLINWENDGKELIEFKSSVIRNKDYQFKQAITWSFVSTSSFGVRFSPAGALFDVGGSSVFPNDDNKYYLTGFMNSKLSSEYMLIQNPTLNFQVGNVSNLPLIVSVERQAEVEKLVRLNIEISKSDWDSYETSWGFTKNPIIAYGKNEGKISKMVELLRVFREENFTELKINEEKLNSIFISIYNLENQMKPDVDENQVTVSIFDLEHEVKSLISYAIGCVFGRYDLEQEGLIYAGGKFDSLKYTSIKPTDDNIVLIIEEDYFENDILHRFIKFLIVVFSEDTLEENLKYIAEVLNPKSKDTPRQTIRNYFVKDFYNDHVKMYKKRPIYWMIDSGKQNGIKALFYMHRYDKSTIARFRTDYLHEIQRYYENDIELTEKSNDKKKIDNLKKKLLEITEFDKVVAHIAHQQLEFDLDDGVDHNYELFQGIEVPQGDGQKPMKADLLAKRK